MSANLDGMGSRGGAFGGRLARLRAERRLSQLQLGLAAEVSARHISFLETGRATPSRDMVDRLARALGLPPAVRDSLLLAAGLAPSAWADAPADPLDRAIDIQTAACDDQALNLVRAGLQNLGLGRFFVGILTPGRAGAAATVSYGDLRHAPGPWLAHYRQRGFRADDPFFRAVEHGARPFFWEDVLRCAPPPTGRQRQVLSEASDFGITGGFVMPIRFRDGRVLALSAMGERVMAGDPRVRWEAQLLATAALDRLAPHA